jgi:hypothetical protein
MKRPLTVAIICLSVGHARGMAQKPSPYQFWGDLRGRSCSNWMTAAEIYANGQDREKWMKHAPEHAWAYGFIAGTGLMPTAFYRSNERLMRIDVRGIDERIDKYCAAQHNETLETALNELVKELRAMR